MSTLNLLPRIELNLSISSFEACCGGQAGLLSRESPLIHGVLPRALPAHDDARSLSEKPPLLESRLEPLSRPPNDVHAPHVGSLKRICE